MKRAALVLLLLAAASPARAIHLIETDAVGLDLNADVKTFSVLLFPYEHPLLYPSTDPQGMGALDLRLKLQGFFGEHFSFKLHPKLTATTLALGSSSPGGGGLLFGGGGRATPEAITLSHTWPDPADGPAAQTLAFRVDRLYLKFDGGPLSVTLGRQAISFGTAFFFSPMDLVSPFSATTIDQEYRPGIDAARVDLYLGESTAFTLVGAYVGDWSLSGTILAARGGTTLGVWDVGAFAALNREDVVLGLDTQGAIGPVGVRAEGTVTVPPEGGSVFYRMVLGANTTFPKGSASAELYWQSNGELESLHYAAFATSERFARGELWVMSRYYAAASASYELHPLVNVSLFGIVNLVDPSALVGPGLTWSIADEASLDFGLYLGLGERPAESLGPGGLDLGSEFGPMPVTSYLVLKAYL